MQWITTDSSNVGHSIKAAINLNIIRPRRRVSRSESVPGLHVGIASQHYCPSRFLGWTCTGPSVPPSHPPKESTACTYTAASHPSRSHYKKHQPPAPSSCQYHKSINPAGYKQYPAIETDGAQRRPLTNPRSGCSVGLSSSSRCMQAGSWPTTLCNR